MDTMRKVSVWKHQVSENTWNWIRLATGIKDDRPVIDLIEGCELHKQLEANAKRQSPAITDSGSGTV